MDTRWREILEQVERGELTPEEGAERLAAQTRQFEPLEPAQTGATQEPTGPSSDNPVPGPAAPEPEVVEDFHSALSFWKRWWTLPLWAGVIVCVLSGLAMSSSASSGRMFWFYCSILPALFGAMVVVLSLWSRKSRWVHVRIRENGSGRKKNIAISLPIPTELVAWGLGTFGHRIPGLREQPGVVQMMPELMKAIDETGDPLVVEVNEKDGAEVRVYIM